jgi:DNA-binding transcriptional regulator PaaX
MRARDLEFLNTTEEGKFLQSRLRAWGMVREDIPLVPSWVTYAELRRMVARLRSGKMRGDPRIPPNAIADFIETSMEQDMMVQGVTMAAREQVGIERELEQRNEAERARRAVAGFHRLKQSAKADPESPVAEKVRRIHRLRRNALGRPRKRKD